MRNIEKEIDLLKQMIRYNLDLVETFEENMKRHKSIISQLGDQGMDKKSLKGLEDDLRYNTNKVRQLNTQITNSQIPKIKRLVSYLERIPRI